MSPRRRHDQSDMNDPGRRVGSRNKNLAPARAANVKVAVVGAGTVGTEHIRAYCSRHDTSIVGVCDTDAKKLEWVKATFGVQTYTSIDELLDRERPSLVSVCTMPVSHRPVTLASLACGAHVLCEKPFGLNADEAREMSDAARRAQRLLVAGFNQRFVESAQRARTFVDRGRLGDALFCIVRSVQEDIPWSAPHYVKTISGGGVLASSAVHNLDMALWLTKFGRFTAVTASACAVFPHRRRWAVDEEVQARYSVEDSVSAHVRFDGNRWLLLDAGWARDNTSVAAIEIVGTKATLLLYPLKIIVESRDTLREEYRYESPDDWGATFAREIDDVVAAIRRNEPPTVRLEEVLAVRELLDATYRSADEGREILAGGSV